MDANVLLVRLPPARQDLRDRLMSSVGAGDLLDACEALETGEWYVYLQPGAALRAPLPGAAGVALELTLALDGASAEAAAPFHYVVETDVAPEAEVDFNDWYDREHLPGLASVPGTVRAWRYRNAHGSPRYLACYDLASLETFGSPPWLAVRGTAWSSRVRPFFRNTKRTMFRKIEAPLGNRSA